MAAIRNLARFTERAKFLNKCYFASQNGTLRSFSMNGAVIGLSREKQALVKFGLISAATGVAVGAGYAYYRINETRKNIALEGTELDTVLLEHKPPVTPSRKIVYSGDTTGLKLTLFQYQTCPFCCKVRAFLDYYGISYDVVEVDPVLRKEIGWSSYKKVPILLTQLEGGYQPLKDSSMIVSLLASHLYDRSQKIEEFVDYYPSIGMHDETGKFKYEIINKYFLMFNNQLPKDRAMDDIIEERKWRKWADDVFVHTLSPNVYRTLDESYKTFNWFSEVGKWEEYFPTWERLLIVNVGAMAMWLIGKRLKKRHHLKNDVRQSLYDEANYWLRSIKARGTTFMGGNKPDLSDLAIYGILKSIEGCEAFQDLKTHTNIDVWYNAMKEQVDAHSGSVNLSR
ncbi:Prostaglandin E synthase 2 [Trachymyrmex septentrionalis]|uniref:Prostaglandin E synthase 2 n=1 Tax=Trachymyrmex septentrionalis TaxID=34720 RepID=A0A195EW35_9HYME|nr:PREDICTED: prostaglandin E synthase 2 [Trachymyrmex septentrionalis]KYN32361.1 Prostaglandin E synthase 2 [Trachymyrmex septentrionalis]